MEMSATKIPNQFLRLNFSLNNKIEAPTEPTIVAIFSIGKNKAPLLLKDANPKNKKTKDNKFGIPNMTPAPIFLIFVIIKNTYIKNM